MSRPKDPPEKAFDAPSSWTSMPPRDLTNKTLGDYHVERMLGHGGMGEVYLARQLSLDRAVAFKVLRPELASNPTNMARFEAEARAAAKLNHPNIVHIYAVDEVDGVRYIAMEYVQGTNLREYLQKKGVPDLPLALAIMRQSALAVGAAGEAGLIHRDIKPENLLLTKKGQVKVADFGLSRATTEEQRLHLTQKGTTLGTPMYMSPEQVQGNEVDHRSDLYSLGVTFYHMLAGQPPFRAETAVAMALKHVHETPTSLAVHRPDLPKPLVSLVMKLMAKDPENRYPSAAEMLKDLSRIKEMVLGRNSKPELSTVGKDASLKTALLPEPAVTQPIDDEDRGPWKPGFGTFSLVGALMLVIGGLAGWIGRAEDLLSPSSPQPDAQPGVWMASWSSIRSQPTASDQYRYALLQSSPSNREAAWLAVPGRFPKDHEWTYPAYIQLARHYLRTNDLERLRTLARELSAAEKRTEPPREKWLQLVKLIGIAEAAVEGDAEEVGATFQGMSNLTAMDPSLAELGLESVLKALQVPAGPSSNSKILQGIRDKLIAFSGPLKIPHPLFTGPLPPTS